MKKILLLAFALLIQACAFTDTTLPVAHSSDANFSGPLADVSPKSFLAPSLSDNREDTARIGYKKNGYGQNTADIFTSQPVTDIVQNALSSGLQANGHLINGDGKVKVVGSIDKFWFETDINFWTIEFVGDIQCNLTFLNSETNEEIYSSAYKGTYSEKKAAGLEATWTEVMSKAVDKLIEDIMFDEDLHEALEAL